MDEKIVSRKHNRVFTQTQKYLLPINKGKFRDEIIKK